MHRRTFLIGTAAAPAGASALSAAESDFDPGQWLRDRKLGRLTTVTPQSGKPFQPFAARTPAQWIDESALYLKAFRELIGPWPTKRPPLDARVLGEKKTDKWTRYQVSFASLPSKAAYASTIKAWLFVPSKAAGKRPAIVTPHQTLPQGKDEPAGIKASLPWMAHATYYAERGYVTLAADSIGFGERTDGGYAKAGFELADAAPILDGHPDMTLLGLMLFDVSRCLDFLAERPEVDAERIGVVGHSLGGILVNGILRLEPRFKVGVASCGYGLFRTDELFPERWAAKNSAYVPRLHLYTKDAEALPLDFHHIMALAAPRALNIHVARGDTIWTKPAVANAAAVAAELKRLWKLLGKGDDFDAVIIANGETDRNHGWYPEGQKAADAMLERVLKPAAKSP